MHCFLVNLIGTGDYIPAITMSTRNSKQLPVEQQGRRLARFPDGSKQGHGHGHDKVLPIG